MMTENFALLLLREQHEAMVMTLRRPSSSPKQREMAERAITVWRKVEDHLANLQRPRASP
jgi:hypothetical protein